MTSPDRDRKQDTALHHRVVEEMAHASPPAPEPLHIFEQISLVALALDIRLRVVRFNAAASRLFGRDPDLILGRPYAEALPDLIQVNADRAFERTLALGVPTEVHEIEIFDHERGQAFFFDFVVDPVVNRHADMVGVSIVGRDVTERVRLRRRLARQNEDLVALNHVSNALRGTMDLDKAFAIIASALTSSEGGGYDHAMIFTLDETGEHLVGDIAVDSIGLREAWIIWRDLTRHDGPLDVTLKATQPVLARRWGELTEKTRGIRIPLADAQGVLSFALHSPGPITQEAMQEHPELRFHPDFARHFPMSCFAAAPLVVDNQPIGVVIVDASKSPREFTEERLNMLRMFANQAALAINNGKIFRDVLDRAQRDSLTHLFNHGHFQERLRSELDRARRYHQPISLVLLDIDHFKAFNDNYGHQTGDLVLKQTALVLTAAVRISDLPARYGGEEFVLLLPQTPHAAAVDLAQRLRAGIERKVVVSGPGGEKLHVTASFGVATYPAHGEEASKLVARCDEALYLAKDNGRNRVESADNLPPQGFAGAEQETETRPMHIPRETVRVVKSRIVKAGTEAVSGKKKQRPTRRARKPGGARRTRRRKD